MLLVHHRRNRPVLAVAFIVVLALPACRSKSEGSAEDAASDDLTARAPGAPQGMDTIRGRMLTIARTYQSYGVVDTQALWGPVPCAPTAPWGQPTRSDIAFSEADAQALHGQKLFYVFASDGKAYLGFTTQKVKDMAGKESESTFATGKPYAPEPVGQTVVKEAWVPVDVTASVKAEGTPPPGHARKADKVYKTGAKAGLFVMTKLDSSTPDTDEGWIYGVISADGTEVIEAGKLEHCAACHRQSKTDRLFGLPARTGF